MEKGKIIGLGMSTISSPNPTTPTAVLTEAWADLLTPTTVNTSNIIQAVVREQQLLNLQVWELTEKLREAANNTTTQQKEVEQYIARLKTTKARADALNKQLLVIKNRLIKVHERLRTRTMALKRDNDTLREELTEEKRAAALEAKQRQQQGGKQESQAPVAAQNDENRNTEERVADEKTSPLNAAETQVEEEKNENPQFDTTKAEPDTSAAPLGSQNEDRDPSSDQKQCLDGQSVPESGAADETAVGELTSAEVESEDVSAGDNPTSGSGEPHMTDTVDETTIEDDKEGPGSTLGGEVKVADEPEITLEELDAAEEEVKEAPTPVASKSKAKGGKKGKK